MDNLTHMHHPSTGQSIGSSLENEGDFGDKMEGGFSKPGGDTVEGDYETSGSRFGPGPHSPANPACTGPPLASFAGPNGAIDQ